MRTILALAMAAALAALPARATTVLVDVHNIVSGAVANRQVTVTLTDPSGTAVAGPWLVAGDSVTVRTGSDGVAGFTNLLALGKYRVEVAGNPSRSMPFSVSDTNGTYYVTSLIGTNVFPQVFYDVTQVEARIAANKPSYGLTSSNGTATVTTNTSGLSTVWDLDIVGGAGGGGTNSPTFQQSTNIAAYQAQISTNSLGSSAFHPTTDYYSSGNPSGYQTAGQVNTLIGAASLNAANLFGYVPNSSLSSGLSFTNPLFDVTASAGPSLRGPGGLRYNFLWQNDHLRLTNTVWNDWLDLNNGLQLGSGSSTIGWQASGADGTMSWTGVASGSVAGGSNYPTANYSRTGALPSGASVGASIFARTDANSNWVFTAYSPGAATFDTLGSGANNSGVFVMDTGSTLYWTNNGKILAYASSNVNASAVSGGATGGQLPQNTIATNAASFGDVPVATGTTFKYIALTNTAAYQAQIATNSLNTALGQKRQDATNDLNTALVQKLTDSTNAFKSSSLLDATNGLNTALVLQITDATNELRAALDQHIYEATNSFKSTSLLDATNVLRTTTLSASNNWTGTNVFASNAAFSNASFGTINAGTITGNGSGLSNLGGIFNAKDFGAATNSADNTAAIQAAIYAATNNMTALGAVVQIPSGRYTCLGQIHLYPSVGLRGAGMQATELYFPNQIVGCIDYLTNNMSGVRDMVFVGVEDLTLSNPWDTVTNTGSAIYFKPTGSFFITPIIRNVQVKVNGTNGVFLGQYINGLVDNAHISYSSGDGLYLGDGNAIAVRSGYTARNKGVGTHFFSVTTGSSVSQASDSNEAGGFLVDGHSVGVNIASASAEDNGGSQYTFGDALMCTLQTSTGMKASKASATNAVTINGGANSEAIHIRNCYFDSTGGGNGYVLYVNSGAIGCSIDYYYYGTWGLGVINDETQFANLRNDERGKEVWNGPNGSVTVSNGTVTASSFTSSNSMAYTTLTNGHLFTTNFNSGGSVDIDSAKGIVVRTNSFGQVLKCGTAFYTNMSANVNIVGIDGTDANGLTSCYMLATNGTASAATVAWPGSCKGSGTNAVIGPVWHLPAGTMAEFQANVFANKYTNINFVLH